MRAEQAAGAPNGGGGSARPERAPVQQRLGAGAGPVQDFGKATALIVFCPSFCSLADSPCLEHADSKI